MFVFEHCRSIDNQFLFLFQLASSCNCVVVKDHDEAKNMAS